MGTGSVTYFVDFKNVLTNEGPARGNRVRKKSERLSVIRNDVVLDIELFYTLYREHTKRIYEHE